MAKAMTNIDLRADKLFNDAVQTLVTTYNQTKTAADYGVLTWDRAEKVMVKAALRKNRRGNTGFRGDIVLASSP